MAVCLLLQNLGTVLNHQLSLYINNLDIFLCSSCHTIISLIIDAWEIIYTAMLFSLLRKYLSNQTFIRKMLPLNEMSL